MLRIKNALHEAEDVCRSCDTLYHSVNSKPDWEKSLITLEEAAKILEGRADALPKNKLMLENIYWQSMYAASHLLRSDQTSTERNLIFTKLHGFASKITHQEPSSLSRITLCQLFMSGRPKKKGYSQKIEKLLSVFDDTYLIAQSTELISKLSDFEKLDLSWCALEIASTLKACGKKDLVSKYYDMAMNAYKTLPVHLQHDHAWLFVTMLADDDCMLKNIGAYNIIKVNADQRVMQAEWALLWHARRTKPPAVGITKEETLKKREAVEELVSARKTKMAK